MALAKDRIPHDSKMGLVQANTHYGNAFGGPSVQISELSSSVLYGFEDHHHKKLVFEELGDNKNVSVSHSSSHSSPSSTNSTGIVYHQQAMNYQHEEAHSVINFKSGYHSYIHTGGSVLSFQQTERINPQSSYPTMCYQDQYTNIWEENSSPAPQSQLIKYPRLLGSLNCIQTASNHGSTSKDNHHEDEPFEWLNTDADDVDDDDGAQELRSGEPSLHKRIHMGESMQPLKKQCTTAATKKPKPKSTPAKDPQSIAAKNRRERISERLKILQDLVPNGSKVDLVTMLEKAINYVKFLQLQVKVLATDEFWPVQGGKAPELSQVKEAIDAVLTSQRDSISSSK
ncbi:unnamed protein product [Ilex paraguariensis]|uniref:BHLH domain-containing protein n=1 Tax=Ilex paraguariensis TaxID=185542 RepID=A0ABC8S073_9AQUA